VDRFIPKAYLNSSEEELKKVTTFKARAVIPENLVRPTAFTLHHGHVTDTGAHCPKTRVVLTMLDRYYRPNLKMMVYDFLKRCKSCQLSTPTTAYSLGLSVAEAASRARCYLHLDLAVNLNTSHPHRYKHILIMADNFSGYIVAAPLRDRTSAAILEAFKHSWAANHGLPAFIKSDNELGIAKSCMEQFMNQFQIKHVPSIPGNPQGNGRAEAAVKAVKTCLRSVTLRNDCAANWPDKLWMITSQLNSSISSSTLQTPEYLMYQQYNINRSRDPIMLLRNPRKMCQVMPDHVDRKLFHEIAVAVANERNLQVARNLEYRNKHRQAPDFAVGDLVLLKIWAKSQAPGVPNALLPRWSGPWEIQRVHTKLVELKHCLRGHIRISGKMYIKHYFESQDDLCFPPNWDKPLIKFLKEKSPAIDRQWLKENPLLPETLPDSADDMPNSKTDELQQFDPG
jgi:hypothetical protein